MALGGQRGSCLAFRVLFFIGTESQKGEIQNQPGSELLGPACSKDRFPGSTPDIQRFFSLWSPSLSF